MKNKKLTIIKMIINPQTVDVQTLYYAYGAANGQIWVSNIEHCLLLSDNEAFAILDTLDCENNFIALDKIKSYQSKFVKGYTPIVCEKEYGKEPKPLPFDFTNYSNSPVKEQTKW